MGRLSSVFVHPNQSILYNSAGRQSGLGGCGGWSFCQFVLYYFLLIPNCKVNEHIGSILRGTCVDCSCRDSLSIRAMEIEVILDGYLFLCIVSRELFVVKSIKLERISVGLVTVREISCGSTGCLAC